MQQPLKLRFFIVLYLIALVVRLPILWSISQSPDRAVQDDSKRYWELADNLRHYQTLGLADEENPWHQFSDVREANGTIPPRDANGLRPEGLRTPGYPLLLAVLQSIWRSMTLVVALQVVLAGVTAGLIAAAAYGFSGSRRGAWLAGLGWALHPAIVIADANVLTESTFSFGVALTLFLLSRARSGRAVMVAALIAGLMPMIRPFGVFLAVPVVLMALQRTDRRWLNAVLAGIITVTPTVLWSARNQAKGEGFRLCTVGDLTLYYYFAHYVRCEQSGKDWRATWPSDFVVRTRELEQRVKPGEDVYAVASQMAREQIKSDPKTTAKILAKSQFKLWFAHSLGDAHRAFGLPYQPSGLMAAFVLGEGNESGFRPETLMALAWTSLNGLMFIAMLWAIVVSIRRRNWGMLFCCVSLLGLSAAGTMCVGQERFRIPMMVPMLILIGGSMRPKAASTPT